MDNLLNSMCGRSNLTLQSCLRAGTCAAHKPYLCERLQIAACWCGAGGMGRCKWPTATQRVASVVCMRSLWPRRWHCFSGWTCMLQKIMFHWSVADGLLSEAMLIMLSGQEYYLFITVCSGVLSVALPSHQRWASHIALHKPKELVVTFWNQVSSKRSSNDAP